MSINHYTQKQGNILERSTWLKNCPNCGTTAERTIPAPIPEPGQLIGYNCGRCRNIYAWEVPYYDKPKYRREKTAALEAAVFDVFHDEQDIPLTVRRVYYALTVKGAIEKTVKQYKQVCNLLANMRRSGSLPYYWFSDSTRLNMKAKSHDNLSNALEYWQTAYRRNIWREQPVYIEVWLEKDALAGVIYPITSEYDVPLMICRGYPSMTFLYNSAEHIKDVGKQTFIYHLGDHDPSGVNASEKVNETLRAHGAEFTFERLAVTTEQIERYNLPTEPTKKKDTRARAFGDKPSVELDAIPTPILRDLVRSAIEKHIDPAALQVTREAEQSEQQTFAAMIGKQFGTSPKLFQAVQL